MGIKGVIKGLSHDLANYLSLRIKENMHREIFPEKTEFDRKCTEIFRKRLGSSFETVKRIIVDATVSKEGTKIIKNIEIHVSTKEHETTYAQNFVFEY